MKIYKSSDKISIKIHDIEVQISPLKMAQKQEIMGLLSNFHKTSNMNDLLHATRLALKYSLKSLVGAKNADDSDFVLEFDELGISDDMVEALMNSELANELSAVASAFINGVPTNILDQNKKPIEGVEILGVKKQ